MGVGSAIGGGPRNAVLKIGEKRNTLATLSGCRAVYGPTRNEPADQPTRCTLSTPRRVRMYSITVSISSRSLSDVFSVNGYECAQAADSGLGIRKPCCAVGALHGSSIFGR